ncbi:hypothetical protein V8V91_26125 [Algoriphagus halophilus]|uniref:hypothetical protein n=1 Tax=Algoriphagus halophilus TaxID=226505 RepID=UPI00358F0570
MGNKGSSGGRKVQVTELKSFIDQGKTAVLTDILKRRYVLKLSEGLKSQRVTEKPDYSESHA